MRTSGASEEENLRAALARSDALAGTVLPILRHLVHDETGALFGDEILARVRATLAHLARELLAAVRGLETVPSHDPVQHALYDALLATPALLAHCHAQALEWSLTERLAARCGIDPVVPPLLQRRIDAPEGRFQPLASRLLAAQARWAQGQRRMQIALLELPGEALHAALLALRSVLPDDALAQRAEAELRVRFDEGAGRLGLAARFVIELGDDAGEAFELQEAGVALFITAIALHAGERRDAVVLATHEMQATRLALALLAAGLRPLAAERQIGVLHPQARLAPGLGAIGAEQATAILRDARHGIA